MADLFEPLRRPTEPLPGLPAQEVRRRGDRLRRRRNALTATGATLAVAVVVTGGVALGDRSTSGSPAPVPPAGQATSEAPDVAWRTTIRAGFPLADDIGKPRFEEEELTGPGRDVQAFDRPLEACGRTADLGEPDDSLAVRYTQPEWFDGRVLHVYPDDATAERVRSALVGIYESCPEDVFPGPPDTVATATVRPVPHGQEGTLVQRTFAVGGLPTVGLDLLHVVRVGNAVLVSRLSNEGGGSPEATTQQLEERDAAVADVVAAMCVFAEDGCGG